jgi:hypothetical protein
MGSLDAGRRSASEPDNQDRVGILSSPSLYRTADLLGVNELHAGRCRSLVQLARLGWSDEVGVGRQGCCTSLLYAVLLTPEELLRSAWSNATLDSAPFPELPGSEG